MKLWRFLLLAGHALAASSVLGAAERVALVIGNNDYKHASKLANPIRDAMAMEAWLKAGDWEVRTVKDAGVVAMRRALREFCQEASGAQAAMVFYAGHGIEVRGKNYLLPVDATLSDEAGEDALPVETLPVDDLLTALGNSKARLKIVVLDSCRNDPLSRSWLRSRSAGGGLAEVGEKALAEGTMLVFSTAPGKAAPDGAGRHSPFTTALLDRMKDGGGLADVFGDVAVAMGKDQEAWIRFDGSGRSFAAFRAFPLFPGKAPSPPPLAELMDPEPAQAVAEEDLSIVGIMKKSLRNREIQEFQESQILEWKEAGEEVFDGKSYRVGVVVYEVETILGLKKIQAKALIQKGKVEKWVSWASGVPIQ